MTIALIKIRIAYAPHEYSFDSHMLFFFAASRVHSNCRHGNKMAAPMDHALQAKKKSFFIYFFQHGLLIIILVSQSLYY